MTLVDLMIVYTPAARDGAGGGPAIREQIQTAMREANLVLLNSRVQTRVRLVHEAEVMYSESGLVATDLSRLRDSGDGFMDEVHALRDEVGADLVCLITERGFDYQFYGLQGPSAQNAFSILQRPFLVGGNALPVTLSFNFGCQLGRPYADSVGAFPYSYGHVFNAPDGTTYGTVDAIQFYRVPWFSNPEIRFQDVSCGIPAGRPFAADNAKTLDQTASIVSAFRGVSMATKAPTISIASPLGTYINPLQLIEDANVTLRFAVSDADGAVQRIEIFATPDQEITQQFLGAVTNADAFVLTNVAAGDYAIFAVAFDNTGASSRSSSNLMVSVQPQPPINDNFADAIELTGTNIAVAGRTTSATLEPGEPKWGWPNWHSADASVWYSWTAPVSGRMQMAVPGLQPVMGAAVGNSASNFTWLIPNTSGLDGLYTRIEFDVLEGTNYHFFIAGQELRPFILQLTLNPMLHVRIASPTNDARFSVREAVPITAETYPLFPDSVTRVEFFADGLPIGNSLGTPFTTMWTNETSGVHQITARAFDSQGRSNDSPAIRVILAPANDDFENATALTGSSIFLIGRNHSASLQPSEPSHGGLQNLNSVWWSWTAPASGQVTCSVFFPGTWPALAVYTGTALTDLSQVALAFNYTLWPGTFFEAEAGATYFFALATGVEGDFHLHLELVPRPTNDSFLQRLVLVGPSVTVTNVTTAATSEIGEPAHAGTAVQHSVWLSWTPPFTRNIEIFATSIGFTPRLAAYVGDSLSNLVTVSSETNQPTSFRGISGVEYHIAVDGMAGGFGEHVEGEIPVSGGVTYQIAIDTLTPSAEGAFTLQVSFEEQQQAGDLLRGQAGVSSIATANNDNFADRLTIMTNTLITGDTRFATLEPGEVPLLGGGGTLWWTFTAPVDGTLAIVVDGSSPRPPEVGAWLGDSVTNLTLVGSNVYYSDLGHWMTLSSCYFPVAADIPSQISVDYRGDRDKTFSLQVFFVPLPANDNFANRELVSGTNVAVTASNLGATKEANEPEHAGQAGGASVWWTWTAPSRGLVTLRFSGFAPLIGVYTGDTLGSLVAVPFSPEPYFPEPEYKTWSFFTEAGTTYQIAIDGEQAAQWFLDWSLTLFPPPLNDMFAAAAPISGNRVIFQGFTDYSSRETGEPLHSGWTIGGGTVWFTWTAPANGHVSIDPPISLSHAFVYAGSALTNLLLVSDAGTFYAVAGQTYRIALSDVMVWIGQSQFSLTAPPPPPRLTPKFVSHGQLVNFQIFGELGQSYVIQASTNLVEWETITIDTMQSNRMEFTDLHAADYQARFFRILPLESMFMPAALRLGKPVSAGTAACSIPVFGPAGQPFILRASENLIDWTELGRGLITEGGEFPDPAAAEHAARFYHAVELR